MSTRRSPDPTLARDSDELPELNRVATRARRLLIEMVHRAGAGHLGGPLSVVDILVALFFGTMNVRPDEPDWTDRDRFVLSKGHAAVALYAVMGLRGYFSIEELETFDQVGSRLQSHPDATRLACLDASTGSLGQGFSAAIGIALGGALKSRTFRTWVVLGDGECQEGQVWEGAQLASRLGLGSLTAIVDANDLQQYGWPDSNGVGGQAVPVPDLARKWEAFGWTATQVDGHDVVALTKELSQPAQVPDRPRLVIAHTVKGRGVGFMEGRPEWHARPLSQVEYAQALADLA
jgi:transketolase